MTVYAEKALPEHRRHIFLAAARGDLGPASRVVFNDLWEQIEAEPGVDK